MRPLAIRSLTLVLLAVACERAAPPPAARAADAGAAARRPAAPPDAAVPDAAPPPADAGPPPALIGPGFVGGIQVGKPLPPALVPADAETRWFGGMIADAQPIEGLHLASPPVDVITYGRGMDSPPTPPREMVRKARAGKLRVRFLAVTDPGPRTAKGTGVGSTLAELVQGHGAAPIHPVPPTYGRDECVATVADLPGVVFHFVSCKDANAGGKVVRILVNSP